MKWEQKLYYQTVKRWHVDDEKNRYSSAGINIFCLWLRDLCFYENEHVRFDMNKCTVTNYPKCPYCDTSVEVSWEDDIRDQDIEAECSDCNKKFFTHAYTQYFNTRSCKLNQEEHDFVKEEENILEGFDYVPKCLKCGEYDFFEGKRVCEG